MTSYHTLTRAEFDAVASGEPDAAVIGTLRSGQYSKRIVMIRAILAVAADRRRGDYPSLEAAYDLLAAAQARNPATVYEILTHPSVGPWAARCLRRLQFQIEDRVPLSTDLGQFAAISAAAAIRAGHTFAIEIPMRDGTVMLPTLGLATLPGPDPLAYATVSNNGRHATVTVGQHTVSLPADPSQDCPGWQGLRILQSRLDSTAITIDFDDLDPGRDCDDVPVDGRHSDGKVTAWQSTLDGAWETLARHHPRRAVALAAGLRCITPLERTGPDGVSVTAKASFGGLALTPPQDSLAFADTLIHEFQHSVLSAVTDLTPLHTGGPDAVHYSPWRDDPRPIEGLLQGAYAYLGVAGFWEIQRGVLTGRQQALADFEFARWRQQVPNVARALLESGTLTESGRTLVRGMAAAAERWRNLAVADEPRRLAEQAVADHAVRWRLRNRQPDPAAIDPIAWAWQNGQPCPADLEKVPTTVLPQQRRLTLGPRIRLFRLRLADPGRFGELYADPSRCHATGITASESDLAYASDDFDRAAAGYRAAIHADPHDIESWSGLVLATTALRGRKGRFYAAPEIARSAYLKIIESIGTGPDLTNVDDWLDSVAFASGA